MGSSDFKLHYWPGLTIGLFFVAAFLSYIIAVLNGHVYYYFPYISDTGAIPPGSCIFGQLMNFYALAMGTTLYIRYRQVEYITHLGAVDIPMIWNDVSIRLTAIVCLGLTIVANFQLATVFAVHMFGASLAFGIGTIYFCIQTRISFACRLKPNKSTTTNFDGLITNNILFLRIVLNFLFFPLGCATLYYGFLAHQEFKGATIIWWTENDGGFELRLISTFSEWILAFLMQIYIFTFTYEFKGLHFREIVIITDNNNSEPVKLDALKNISPNCLNDKFEKNS